MKLPIVSRGSRENPVSPEEINALYQSWGSAGTTRCPCTVPVQSFPSSPKGQACPVPTANTPNPKTREQIPGSLCPSGPCRAWVTPQLVLGRRGALGPVTTFSRWEAEGMAASHLLPVPKNAQTLPALKNPHLNTRSPPAEQRPVEDTALCAWQSLCSRGARGKTSQKTPKPPEKHRHSSQPGQEALP